MEKEIMKERKIDLTPTKKRYINILKVIIQGSTNEDDKRFALDELVKLANGATYMEE